MGVASSKRSKHVPERTCLACRQKRPKWELVRIVRTSPGVVEIDFRGKKAGRGAYLCKSYGCWQAGLRKKRISYALKTEIIAGSQAELERFCESLFATPVEHRETSSA